VTSASPWAPTFDFESDPNPQDRVNATALQAQLRALSASLAELYTALETSIRDDDTLTDELVRLRNLHSEVSTYIDTLVTGTTITNSLEYWYPVRAASTEDVASLVDAQTIDGVDLVSGDRVLLKDQTIASQNGLWIVYETGDPAPHAAGLWERADELPADEASGSGWAVCVEEGDLNGETAWMPVTGGDEDEQPVVGTDDLEFMPVFAPFPLPIARGGTGAATAAAARAALGVPGKESDQITGDDVTTSFVVAHSLGTALVFVAVQENATGEEVLVTITKTSANVTLTFATAPADGVVYDVTIVG
jgi:hypothetical protein